jgi:L-iditol 2-dehydrogenase
MESVEGGADPPPVPKMMKAGVLHAIGDIRCDEVATPRPGPDDVIVRVRACGICGSDISRVFQTGMYHLPEIPGHEFGGEVAELGPNVTGVPVGERVAVVPLIECGKCPSCLIGEYSMCENYDYLGSRSAGGFAEYVRAPARNLVRLPDGLDFETGALTEVMAVALHAVRRAGGLSGGERVAVFGAGTVGLLAAQFARLLGAGAVCAVDVVEAKLEVARQIGSDLCVDARLADAVAAIAEWTQGRGADMAIEASGANRALEQAISCLAKSGKLVLVGRQERPVQLAVSTFEVVLRRQLNVLGTWAWSRLPMTEWEVALGFAARGAIQTMPLISHRYSIDRVREAFEMIASAREVIQKVLLVFP